MQVIFGKDKTQGIVAAEVVEDYVVCLTNSDEEVHFPMIYWVLTPFQTKNSTKLEGKQHYKYITTFDKEEEYQAFLGKARKKKVDFYTVYNKIEAAMLYHGFTFYKDIKIEEVSVLAFDIEANGLVKDETSEVFVITNTFRDRNGKITKKQFRVDEFKNDDQQEMIAIWCRWVRGVDPDIITGHNINGYDLPYLDHCSLNGLSLGRDDSVVTFKQRSSKYRVDGSQTWEYHKMKCYGRDIVDGMFLAVKHDIGRNYPSWGLKPIAEYEGWVTEDRQFYDASKIGKDWSDKEKRKLIVKYCEGDSDDSLRVFDLMAPSFFYMCRSIPKPFQLITESASGSWLNSIMVRSYLQEGCSVAKTNEQKRVAGGMSWGRPGVYSNVSKWDAASYYPKTVLTFDIYDEKKDPNAHYLQMVKYFTERRFEQKDKYKETGDKYYDDMQAASKVFINSAYGLLGTPGLNYNSFENASLITKCCRKGLQKAIIWATGKTAVEWWDEYEEEQDFSDFKFINDKAEWSNDEMPKHDWELVNLDTDSLSFCKSDESPWSSDEYQMIHEEINKIMYSEWEDDGSFDRVLVLKAKNYCLLPSGSDKIKKKGSSITDSKKEPALLEMLDKMLADLIYHDGENLVDCYLKYITEVKDILDINRWATKKSISAAVLNPSRTNEQKILDALKGRQVQEGDKVYILSDIDGEVQKVVKGELEFLKDGTPKMIPNRILRLVEDYQGTYDLEHYLKRVWNTVNILQNVVDIKTFTKYHLKGNLKLLETL
jgi:DNA polymerase elongation subunit (family B)